MNWLGRRRLGHCNVGRNFAVAQLGLILRLFSGKAFLGTCFQDRFRLGEIGAAFLAERQLVFDDESFRKRPLTLIRLFTEREQLMNFLAQLGVERSKYI